MQEREVSKAARKAPSVVRSCIVMVCEDLSEADQIARLLEEQEVACLVTYRRAEDLVVNAPRAKVALIILAGNEKPALMSRTLRWLRRRWPHCPVTVVGCTGDNGLEMAARAGGATYLVRPVTREEWLAILEHGLARIRRRQTSDNPRPV
jgi:DNA-binding response OmpR family regulator